MFEKVLNINCSPGDESETLENTKEICKNNKQCIGVYQKTCSNDTDAYQCLKNQTSPSHVQVEGCLYRKIGIGKLCFKLFSVSISFNIYIGFSNRYLLPDTFYYKLDPCDTITCNGTNAQCQIYLGGENKGQPFCACPQGLTGDPNHGCGKHV